MATGVLQPGCFTTNKDQVLPQFVYFTAQRMNRTGRFRHPTLCLPTCQSALDLEASAIIVISDNYDPSRLVAKYRPPCPIISVTSNDAASRQIMGCLRVNANPPCHDTTVFRMHRKATGTQARFCAVFIFLLKRFQSHVLCAHLNVQGCTPCVVESLSGTEAIAFEGISCGRKHHLIGDRDHVVCFRAEARAVEVMDV